MSVHVNATLVWFMLSSMIQGIVFELFEAGEPPSDPYV